MKACDLPYGATGLIAEHLNKPYTTVRNWLRYGTPREHKDKLHKAITDLNLLDGRSDVSKKAYPGRVKLDALPHGYQVIIANEVGVSDNCVSLWFRDGLPRKRIKAVRQVYIKHGFELPEELV